MTEDMACPPGSLSVKTEPPSIPVGASEPRDLGEETLLVSDDEEGSASNIDLKIDAEENVYQESVESLPRATAYDHDFPRVYDGIVRILDNAISAVPPSSRDSSCFKHLLNKAAEYKKTPAISKSRINIVGKSGAGKSSLLNSVLGRPDAAKALAASKGCTQVPTAFEAPFPGQTCAFAVKIEFFETVEIHKKIDVMTKDYYDYHFEDTTEFDKSEIIEIEKAANTAFETFRLLFCNKQEFATEEAGILFLSQSYEKERSTVVKKLAGWCESLIRNGVEKTTHCCPEEALEHDTAQSKPTLPDHDASYLQSQSQSELDAVNETAKFYQADDQQSISDYIELYGFSNSRFLQPSLWPLVKLIRQGLYGVNILNYATLTDWPGADDTNLLRANASSQRIYHCDEIWIVSSADRIATDPAATTNLVRYGNDMRCVLICTCIDDKLDDGLAKEIEKSGHDIGNHEHLLKEERISWRKLQTLSAKKTTLDTIIQRGWAVISTNKRKKISDSQLASYRKDRADQDHLLCTENSRCHQIKQERFDLLIRIRKRYIKSLLDQKLSHHVPENELVVFFVSNSHYAALKGRKQIEGSQMSPEATGIPGLREHVYKSAAPEIVRDLKHFIEHQITVFLEGVKHVANPSSFEGCEAALRRVTERRDRLEPYSSGYMDRLNELTKEYLIDPLTEQQADFAAGAVETLQQKSRWPYPTIKAFVRRNGCHATPTKEYHSWNQEFMKTLLESFTDLWPEFRNEAGCLSKTLKEELVKLCKDIASELDQDASKFRLQDESFKDFIDSETNGIEKLLGDYETNLSKSLALIKIEATKADEECPTGYFNAAMQQAWDGCKEISGPGAKARIMEKFKTHLELAEHRSPFFELTKRLGDEIAKAAKMHQSTMVKDVQVILVDIHKWLNDMFQVDTENATEMEVRSSLQKFHIKAVEDFLNVKELLASIEKKY